MYDGAIPPLFESGFEPVTLHAWALDSRNRQLERPGSHFDCVMVGSWCFPANTDIYIYIYIYAFGQLTCLHACEHVDLQLCDSTHTLLHENLVWYWHYSYNYRSLTDTYLWSTCDTVAALTTTPANPVMWSCNRKSTRGQQSRRNGWPKQVWTKHFLWFPYFKYWHNSQSATWSRLPTSNITTLYIYICLKTIYSVLYIVHM